MKAKRVKRYVCYFVGFLVFSLILYSCLQDESDWAEQETPDKVIKGKNRELNVEVARSWYEARQTPVVSTRSVATNFELLTKLHWKKGYENRKGKFEVVEIPLLTKGSAVLMDKETMEKYKETERGKIRNISRMVIIKNIETGEIINFVMHIVGTYEYLMKAKHFEDNCYLYRTPDLSGSVYFYEPEGGLVNGWVYEDGKIVGTISQGTEEGLKMQEAANTRGMVLIPVCTTKRVYVEHNECNGFVYEDPEYGLGFGSACRKVGDWETVEECYEVPSFEGDDTPVPPWGPDESTGGGGGGYLPQPIAPKAKAIFRNSSMTEENWEVIERMLEKITRNCMGFGLYHGLLSALNGKTITIEFNSSANSAFGKRGEDGSLGITLGKQMESNCLIHEMMHAFQAYRESTTSYNQSTLNAEIEAHFVQYLYLRNLEEYPGSKWEKRDNTDPRRRSIKNLNIYINKNGNLREGVTESLLNDMIKKKIIPSFELAKYNSERGFVYDSKRPVLDNFKNLREITKNCN